MNLPLHTPNRVTPASYGQPCPLCGALCGDAYLCPQCVEHLECQLGDVQMLMHQLDITITRQDNVYRPQPPATVEADTPAPFNTNASQARTNLTKTLATCAAMLIRHIGVHWEWANDAVFIARWIAINTGTLAHHPDAAHHATAIRDAHRHAIQAIDTMPERVLAGPCPTCGSRLMAFKDSTTVRCDTCAKWHQVTNVRDPMRAKVADLKYTLSGLRDMARSLGIRCDMNRVNKLAQRGHITKVGESIDGHALYRVGDFLTQIDRQEGVDIA